MTAPVYKTEPKVAGYGAKVRCVLEKLFYVGALELCLLVNYRYVLFQQTAFYLNCRGCTKMSVSDCGLWCCDTVLVTSGLEASAASVFKIVLSRTGMWKSCIRRVEGLD